MPENAGNPGVDEAALQRHASSSFFSKITLKEKGELQGYIFREEEKRKWCIVVAHNPIANATVQKSVYFDAADVESLETIVPKRGPAAY